MIKKLFGTLLAALTFSALPAHAGLVTGTWDPVFGTALPGWSYKGTFTANVPDYVVNLGPGVVATPDGAVPLTVSVTLFETANPGNQITQAGIALDVQTVSIDSNSLLVQWDSVVVLNTPLSVFNLPWNLFDLDPGVGTLFHTFEFSWDSLIAGPKLRCTTCNGGAGANGSTGGLEIAMTQLADNGQARGTVQINIDQAGNRTTVATPVSLPGTLALLLSAAMALFAVRRAKAPARTRLTQL